MLIFLIMSRVIDQIKTNYLKCQICWARRWLFTLKRVNCNLMFQLLPRKPVISIQSRFDTNSNSKIAQKFQIFFRERKKREECIFAFFFLHILREFIFTGPNFHELLECPKRFHSTRFSHPTVVLCLVKLMTITLLVVPYLICKWKQEVPWFWPSTPTVLQPTWTGNTYKTCSNDMTVV